MDLNLSGSRDNELVVEWSRLPRRAVIQRAIKLILGLIFLGAPMVAGMAG